MENQETKVLCGRIRLESETTLELLMGEHAFCPILEFDSYVLITVKYYDHECRDMCWSWAVYGIEDRVDGETYLFLSIANQKRYAYSGDAIAAALYDLREIYG